MFRSYARLCRLLGNAFLSVSALLLLIMSLTVGWQVWGRYVLNETPISAEPLSLIFMLYLCLLGAAVGVREGYHMGMLVVIELDRKSDVWGKSVSVRVYLGGSRIIKKKKKKSIIS